MADVVSPEKRSEMMAGIRNKDTKPEMLVRKSLHHRGFRYRLHRKDLPGKPDLFFPQYQAAIFVNGCFWHGHDCKFFKLPKTNADFWKKKIEGNRVRDLANLQKLEDRKIRHHTVWECATRHPIEQFEIEMDHLAEWLKSGT